MYNQVQRFLCNGVKYFNPNRTSTVLLQLRLCHCSREETTQEASSLSELYEKATKLSQRLRNVDLVDGLLMNVDDHSVIIDDHIRRKMDSFKSMVRVLIGSPVVQCKVVENVRTLSADAEGKPVVCFGKSSEREGMVVDSLTKVANFLNVSAQQRKSVRVTICEQVTQHRIWAGALEEILNALKLEMEAFDSKGLDKNSMNNMGYQIISSCLKCVSDTSVLSSEGDGSVSWMRLKPAAPADSSVSIKWGNVLEMFNDLVEWLGSERSLFYHVSKIEVMKEGLSQIRNVLIDKCIGYKEARHQENLVQKKLSKTLGHSSRCLFTLLLYYLCGHVRDLEVDLQGEIYGGDGSNRFCLCMGRILTSDEDDMVRSGVKQLDRALGLFKFVWQTARKDGVLELQGHIWCIGAKDRTVTYKGNMFFVHGINL